MPSETTTILKQLSDDLANAVERAGAGVVTVHGRRRLPASGIVWSSDGLIVTANHVVERDEDLTVSLPDGRDVPVTLIGRDPGTDLALLRTEGIELEAATRATESPRVGHLVLAVARPGRSGAMASFGTISVVGGSWRTSNRTPVDGFLRADVAMLPGFSGGPLVDANGAILGLNTSSLGRGGHLTVPNAAIETVVEAITTHGKIQRGFLGIGAQPTRLPASLVNNLGLTNDRGLLIINLEPEGPAERDGVLIGDILLAIDGQPIADVETLQDSLTGDHVGKPLPIQIIRGGQLTDIVVTVGERP